MAVRTIALVDHTRRHRPPDGALEAIAEALTIQIERDFCPAWHREPVRVTVGGRGDKIHFFDTSHDAIDYGWHYVDGDGLPYAHVFVEPSIKNGSDWVSGRDAISISAGHEVLELLGDPAANSYCFDGRDRLWAHEICDAVQERSYRITAGAMRVPMTDFVLPAFFNHRADGPYDQLEVLKRPFTLDAGGYAIYQRSGAEHEQDAKARAFKVVFDKALPRWQRRQKREDWGRTFWRLIRTMGV